MSVINTNTKALVAQQALKVNNRALTSAMEQLSTGKEIVRPSDEPDKAAAVTRLETTLSKHDNYKSALNMVRSRLGFEETALTSVSDALNRIKELGVRVAIDDFGTGQSSLSRLHTLPFDKIKLDRSFVQALQEPMVQSIVKAMSQLADSFSRSLVVEGIETQAQMQKLTELGCKLGQGYFLCRPHALQALPLSLS